MRDINYKSLDGTSGRHGCSYNQQKREHCLETVDNGVSRVLALSRARGHTGRLLIRPEAAIRHALTLKITSKLILFHKRISVCLQLQPYFSSYTSSIAGNYGCQHWVYNTVPSLQTNQTW